MARSLLDRKSTKVRFCAEIRLLMHFVFSESALESIWWKDPFKKTRFVKFKGILNRSFGIEGGQDCEKIRPNFKTDFR